MKFLERFSLRVFSLIIFVASLSLILMMFGIIPATVVPKIVANLTDGDIGVRITLVVCAILMLLALKSFFSKLKPVDEAKNGIILENASGKLIISKESLENLIASVAKNIPGAESISSKTVLDKDRNLKVYVTTTVSSDIMLKEISTELQRKIKEAMKKTADLEVKEVNVKIKNISSKKTKTKEENDKKVDETENSNEENVEENSNREE